MDQTLYLLSRQVGEGLAARGWRIATAESCTGGWVAKVLTDVPGSSAWMERGFVTYTNAAKQTMLGVSAQTLDTCGAVSEVTVCDMARGALEYSAAEVSLAISGIAGPEGGRVDKPVGTVWLAWALRNDAVLDATAGGYTRACRHVFQGGREAVRRQAVVAALEGVLSLLHESMNP